MSQSGRARPGIGVAMLLANKQYKILLGKRKGSLGAGTYSPPGGHLEYGESWEQAAQRELYEEAGVRAFDVRFAAATNDLHEKEGRHYVTIFLRGEYDVFSGRPNVMEPDKNESWGWYSWDDLPSPLFLPVKNLIRTGYRLF
jgi:8-oxo-dGTP diphosphatase